MQVSVLYFDSIILNMKRAFKEGMIKVPGGKVWYKMYGAEKSGIPVLAVHGGPGVPHNYMEPLVALADERPVVFYDQLGCGNSERPSYKSLWEVDRFVEELHQVRDALGMKNVHLVGQSWGTMLIVEYLLRKKPDGVVSIVLSGPYLSTPRWFEDQQALIKLLPQSVQNIISKYEKNGNFASPEYQDAMMLFYKKHVCLMDPWPDSLNKAMELFGTEVYEYMWGPSEFTITGTLKNADLSDRLAEIKPPVLFTCGEYDEATPSTTYYYQSKLPGSEIHIFKSASHSHILEKPDEYITLVRAFMKKSEEIAL